MTGAPEVSVVIPTRDRAARLGAALEALRGQTIAPDRFEVVVVDDGSTDETTELLARPSADGGPEVRAIRLAGQGPAAARNAGWQAARASLVAFTDDDCEPTPTWVESILGAAAASPGAIVQGVTTPIPRESELLRRPFSRTRLIDEQNPFFATCNIAYPRELLERLNGFDELFPEALGEDTDLGWRALEMGASAEFARGAVVHHAVEDLGPAGYMRHALRGADAVYAFRRHPGLRARSLRYGVFRNPSLERLALAGAGLLLARRHRAAVLLALPYARNLLGRSMSSDAGPLLVPYLLTYDLVQAYTSLRGSIRHRRLVL
jgi:glycosyltransferase involved in cell wall biosynthesis